MIQVSSGKFFKSPEAYETLHRGAFYTNYAFFGDGEISTPIGGLFAAKSIGGVSAFAYEIIEKIEWVPPTPGVLISTGGDELVEDFADVLSFALNVVCTRDPDLIRRLIGSDDPQRLAPNSISPQKYLSRVFDPRVYPSPGDSSHVSSFFRELIDLKRSAFEGAIRAIRRYVTATHRLADDMDLAYALFVMAIEALAQTQETPQAAWREYDETKRRRIDRALREAPEEVAAGVRSAVLENEHVAAGRRFRAFVFDHLHPSFFREEVADKSFVIARPDVDQLLKRAYDIRSGYVHRLHAVPRMLSMPGTYMETFGTAEGETLTFQGLARITRHVIIQFIKSGPKMDREDFNWFSVLPNVIQAQMAPQVWMGNPEAYLPEHARLWLQTFIGLMSAQLIDRQPHIVDQSPILDKIDKLSLDGIKVKDRRAILSLYVLYCYCFPEKQKHRREALEKLVGRYEKDFSIPTMEEAAVKLLTGQAFGWGVAIVDKLFDKYFCMRHHKNALQLGRLLEAMFCLRLAEMRRAAGYDPALVRSLISFAVDAHPGHQALRQFEDGLGACEDLPPIDERAILLPPRAGAS